MKLKLLFFCSDYQIGLTQAQTEQVIELCKEKNIELHCVSSEQEQEPGLHKRAKDENVEINIIPHLDVHQNFISLANAINTLIVRHGITHINVQNNWQLALVAYLKYRHLWPRKFKIIYTIHGYRHNSRLKSLAAIGIIGTALLLFADRVISMSSFVSKRFWFIAYKTDIVFYLMNKPEYQKDENSIDGDTLKLVFPAQFRRGKRQEMIIKAVKRYIDETKDRTICLYLPGEGPLLDSMKKIAKDEGINENIIFPGKLMLSDVLNLYNQCNIAVVSSNAETYGRCIAEPFVLGRCLITQKTGVALDIIHDGENGLFFSNSRSLSSLLKKLHDNPNLIVRMGNQAFADRYVFSRDAVMKSYLEALSKA